MTEAATKTDSKVKPGPKPGSVHLVLTGAAAAEFHRLSHAPGWSAKELAALVAPWIEMLFAGELGERLPDGSVPPHFAPIAPLHKLVADAFAAQVAPPEEGS